MQIIDSHHHLLDHAKRKYAFAADDDAGLGRDFLAADLAPILGECGVSQTVLVQAHPSLEEARWLLEVAEATSFIGGVVAWVDLAAVDVGEQLDALTASPWLKGVRADVQDEPDSAWLLRSDVDRGLSAVEERGLVCDLLIRPRHLRSVPEAARRHPNLRFVIDHMAKPFIAAGQREPWGTLMKDIAACANVWCKVSGLVTEDDPANVQVAHARPFVDEVVRLFGFERIMFGSDWPICTRVAGYAQVLEQALASIGPASDAQRQRFLADNARDVYRLGPAAQA